MGSDRIIDILNSEMELATGCTEPAAVALTAAHAAQALQQSGDTLQRLEVLASVNIIKNAMAAGIPGTHYTGIEYAAAIGALVCQPQRQLQIINDVPQEVYTAAEQLVEGRQATLDLAHNPEKLYIDITAFGTHSRARAVISGTHTHLACVELDGRTLYRDDGASCTDQAGVSPQEIMETLSVEKIFHYIDRQLDPLHDPIDIIRQSVAVNTAISQEGMLGDYGLQIGKSLERDCENGFISRDLATNAMIAATAGADARMAGAPFSVVANSGSGNQGITTTMPVVAAAQWLGSTEEQMLRAVTLSNLIAIYIKSKFGRLSALCGATVASTGAACGITYLLGGGLREVGYAVQNMIGNVTGMLCDGAKADCALKISTCTNAAVQAALMARKGQFVRSTDGIVEDDVEQTIENFSRLGNEGSNAMDELMLRMMLEKRKASRGE